MLMRPTCQLRLSMQCIHGIHYHCLHHNYPAGLRNRDAESSSCVCVCVSVKLELPSSIWIAYISHFTGLNKGSSQRDSKGAQRKLHFSPLDDFNYIEHYFFHNTWRVSAYVSLTSMYATDKNRTKTGLALDAISFIYSLFTTLTRYAIISSVGEHWAHSVNVNQK